MSEKTAIVTAGGSGMGAAAARRLAADGFKVARRRAAAAPIPLPPAVTMAVFSLIICTPSCTFPVKPSFCFSAFKEFI